MRQISGKACLAAMVIAFGCIWSGAASAMAAYVVGDQLILSGQVVDGDAERVAARSPSLWQDLLGDERLHLAEVIADLLGEDLDTAATRVWSAGECLTKAGAPFNAPVVLASCEPNGWVTLACGRLTIATLSAQVRSSPEPLVFALLARSESVRAGGEAQLERSLKPAAKGSAQ